MLESDPTTCKTERKANDEPDTQDDQHSGERNRATRVFGPKEKVEEKKCAEHDARYQDGRQGDILLPSISSERLVHSRGNIAANEAKHGPQEKHDCTKRAAI